MLWVTRHHIRVNRAATAWLVRRFVDPAASFQFVEPDHVAEVQQEQGATGFDAPGARYPHKDALGRCSFEALVDEYCRDDAALVELARLVHLADFPAECRLPSADGPVPPLGTLDIVSPVPQSRLGPISLIAEAIGLRTISRGFPLIAADDHETVSRTGFLYDALYASLQERRGP
jgi:hypothetical protein